MEGETPGKLKELLTKLKLINGKYNQQGNKLKYGTRKDAVAIEPSQQSSGQFERSDSKLLTVEKLNQFGSMEELYGSHDREKNHSTMKP